MLGRLLFGAAVMTLMGSYQAHAFDEFERYFQRKDTVTFSAGDAKEVNARAHMLTPWPPGVYDRRIFANGSRMARSVECYEAGPQRQQGGNGQTAGAGGTIINLNTGSGNQQTGASGQQGGC
ncbi:hypothetical protein ACFFWD_43475 [Bradyrhizobium erythrophlei]|uniref:hypothetical protein n=1 Tax=Bradyrhizobium erythrophlei TaxID=1437360 RepID=UPI0035EC39A4